MSETYSNWVLFELLSVSIQFITIIVKERTIWIADNEFYKNLYLFVIFIFFIFVNESYFCFQY